MNKSDIKLRLKEVLTELFDVNEATKKDEKGEHKKNDNSSKQGEGGKKDYSDVQRAFKKIGGPSMVDIMKLALGLQDDEKGVNRSLFRKKVVQEKNSEGSFYQFSDEELTKVRTALSLKN